MAKKTRRPQGDGTIRKRPDGRWEGRIIVGHKNDGSPIFRSVFGTTQKATLDQLHALIDTYQGIELTEDSSMTLGEWLDIWLEQYMAITLRESTLHGYRVLAGKIKAHLGDKKISTITTQMVQKLYTVVKKQGREVEHPYLGKELSNSYVRDLHLMFHEAMDAAVKHRLIAKNPTNGTTIPKREHYEKQVLNNEQLQIFKAEIEKDPFLHAFFYLEIMTGLRRGEICALKWSDVDFTHGILHVRRTVVRRPSRGLDIGETKTDAGKRQIVLPPSVVKLLKEWKKSALNDWIFPHPMKPEDPLHPDTAYNKLKWLLRRTDLPRIRFHDLRHTFATQAIQSGVDAKTLSGILGHTDASFTLDTYTHMTGDMQRGASVVVGNMLKKMIGEKKDA